MEEFESRVEQGKIRVSSLIEEFTQENVMSMSLEQVHINDSYFDEGEKSSEKKQVKMPDPNEVMDEKLRLI